MRKIWILLLVTCPATVLISYRRAHSQLFSEIKSSLKSHLARVKITIQAFLPHASAVLLSNIIFCLKLTFSNLWLMRENCQSLGATTPSILKRAPNCGKYLHHSIHMLIEFPDFIFCQCANGVEGKFVLKPPLQGLKVI